MAGQDSWTIRKALEIANDPQVNTETLRAALRAFCESVKLVEYGEVVLSAESLAYSLGAAVAPR